MKRRTSQIALITLGLVLASTGWAEKGGKGKGNGGDGGGNDTADPDYLVSAVRTLSNEGEPGLFEATGVCKGANPDLKGPGITYLVFFPRGCIAMTTDGIEVDRVAIEPVQDEQGRFVAIEFRGQVDGDGVAALHTLPAIDQITPPPNDADPSNDDANFVFDIDARFDLELCTKRKGRTTCTDIGQVVVDRLDYEFQTF